MRRFLPLLLLAAACTDGKEDDLVCEIASSPLSGIIGGESWTFVQGETDDYLSDDEGFFVSLYAESYDSCGHSWPDGNRLLALIPTAPGEYEFAFGQNATFVVPTDDTVENYVSFAGRMVIDEISETEISGGMCMSYGDENEVSGQFTVAVCPGE